MTRRVLITLAVLSLTVVLLTACGGTPTPPVKKIAHLEQLVGAGQSLEQVQALMTDELWEKATVYPLSMAELSENGNWQFKSKEDGTPGDTDAPFLVVIFLPEKTAGNSLAIIFENGAVVTTEWFSDFYTRVLRAGLELE
jgi:hypothetical protein